MMLRTAVAFCVAVTVITAVPLDSSVSMTAGAAPKKKACPKAGPKAVKCRVAKVRAIIRVFDKNPAFQWCSVYFRLMVCYVHKLPKPVQAATVVAFLNSARIMLKLSKGPSKASLRQSCRLATDSWSKAIRKMPKYMSCFKGIKLPKPKPTKKP